MRSVILDGMKKYLGVWLWGLLFCLGGLAETPVPKEAEPSAEEGAEKQVVTEVPPTQLFSVGFNYVFPGLNYQMELFPKLTLGLSVQIMDVPNSKESSLRGYGTYLSASYYGGNTFSGIWTQFAVGLDFLKVTNASSQISCSPITYQGTLGWRWQTESKMNIGFGVGIHYITPSDIKPLIVTFSGILPAILLDIGFAI